jgi:hypothetical protein
VTDPRPDPGSELAGESEYGNDTGFAAAAAAGAGSGSGSDAEPAAAEDAGDDDPGRGAD